MSDAFIIILLSTIAVGFVHTLIGPDHYIPLIAMAKVRKWSSVKTITITLLCGVAHVLSAALLGIIAVLVGMTLNKLNFIEYWRGNFAAWLLIGFGLLYCLWSIYKLWHNKTHAHTHTTAKKDITIWILVLVFVLGPCEPLIPIMLYAAVQSSIWYIIGVTVLFGIITIFTMLTIVMLAVFSTRLLQLPFLEKYGNTLAGAIICCSGVAIKFLG